MKDNIQTLPTGEATKSLPNTKLREETLDRIDALLVEHEWNGVNRGLYTLDELRGIREHLKDLASWLAKNEPAFLRDADEHYTHHSRFNEKTALCIAYVDHIEVEDGIKPAPVLSEFFNENLAGLYSHLHILPHFPSPIIHEGMQGPSSRADGGFEAMNYRMDPKYGTPEDLMEAKAGLMFDFVLNHLSAKGDLFEKFIENEPGYEDFFITIPQDKLDKLNLAPVFRPREHHPVIPYTNSKGETKNVWCTFSETQADINIKDPRVFCEIMEALVKDFVGQGASWIRLDAIGYLVKMLGVEDREALTDCFGIEETHNVLKAMRAFLRDVAPSVTLVPEVNATESVIKTYYGQNNDEGHLVYEFPSAPLSLFTIYREDAGAILKWAEERNKNPEWIGLAFTNSHDGVGVLPMAEVKEEPEGMSALNFLLHQIERRGGGINYKSKIVDGETVRVPYEACITWTQAILSPPESAALRGNRLTDAEIDEIVDRFMASQSFIYTAPHCVPADYMGVITSLLNDEYLYELAGHRRNKNRGLVKADEFEKALTNPETNYEMLRNKIFNRKKQLIEARQSSPAFSPYALCDVGIATVEGQAAGARPVYSILRHSPHCKEKVVTLTNCTPEPQQVFIERPALGEIGAPYIPKEVANTLQAVDMLSSESHEIAAHGLSLTLAPYQVAWLRVAAK
ncbi:MAG: hypothetical protein H6868_03730 [Rhodospirillales bacterium]|nr:hypothetical protein [Rhodospirillales bacterium]